MQISIHNWMRVEPIETTIQRLSDLGYDGIDIKGEPDLYNTEDVRELLKKYNISCASCVSIMTNERNLIANDPEIRTRTIQYIKKCIDMLVTLGGKVMVVVPGSVGSLQPNGTPEEEWQRAIKSLKICYAYAEKHGITLAIEPINRFETHFINRADQALALAREVGENCGVCLDTFHMNIEEEDISEAILAAGNKLSYIHIADSNRMPPGLGKIRWSLILEALDKIGYNKSLSLEFSPAIDRTPKNPYPNALDNAPKGLTEDQAKFLEAHGSAVISKEWHTYLTQVSIKNLRKMLTNYQPTPIKNPMDIVDVRAYWLHSPIPEAQQHVSDFGRIISFDCVLVEVETRSGYIGYGEAKASVGSSGSCAAIVSCILNDLKPHLLGKDARQINHIWEMLYNGTRGHYSFKHGRSFPVLGRRGLLISALSGIDIALWDLKGKVTNLSVVELLGGRCRDTMPAYASGGWADEENIGEQLLGYTKHGFKGVKMRIGIMDGTPQVSARRVHAARQALGPDIKIMVDAHGTMSVPEAKRFCNLAEDADIFWFEEPCNSDNYAGTAEVRQNTSIPIALGESEFTRFDMREIIQNRAADILQPDCAIVGGITETQRIASLADTYQLALAPHCWGSAISFMAGTSVAFASPAAIIIEYSLGGNPMLHELVNESIQCDNNGMISYPNAPGLGITINQDFVKEFKQTIC